MGSNEIKMNTINNPLVWSEDIFLKAAQSYADRIGHPQEINWLQDQRDNLAKLHEQIMSLKDVGAL